MIDLQLRKARVKFDRPTFPLGTLDATIAAGVGRLPRLKKGARVVSHDFNFPGWKHIKSLTIDDDGEGRSHTLYLYVR